MKFPIGKKATFQGRTVKLREGIAIIKPMYDWLVTACITPPLLLPKETWLSFLTGSFQKRLVKQSQ